MVDGSLWEDPISGAGGTVEYGTWGQFLFFVFLGFLVPNRKILNVKMFRIKISIDLDSLQTYPTSRNLLKIYLKNRVPTILFIAPQYAR